MKKIIQKNKIKKDISIEIVKFWLNFFHIKVSDELEYLLIQIFKFGIVGVVATLIDFIFLYLFRDLCKLPLILSNTLAFTISVIYNYIASMTFVFEIDKSKSKKKTFIIFIIFSVIGLIINNIFIQLLTNTLDIYYMISKVITTIIVMIFNFITRKKFLE